MAIFLEIVFLICFYLGAAMLKQLKISYFFKETGEDLWSNFFFFISCSGWACLLERALTERSSYIHLFTVVWAGHCWASSPARLSDGIGKGSLSSFPLAASCSHDHFLFHHNISAAVSLLFFLWYLFCFCALNFETTQNSGQKIFLIFS